MNKGIKKIELETKKSSKGTEYTVCNVTLVNDKVHQAQGFIDKETMDLVNELGMNKVKFDFVERVGQNDKPYCGISVSIPEIEFEQILFLKRSTVALIKLLSK